MSHCYEGLPSIPCSATSNTTRRRSAHQPSIDWSIHYTDIAQIRHFYGRIVLSPGLLPGPDLPSPRIGVAYHNVNQMVLALDSRWLAILHSRLATQLSFFFALQRKCKSRRPVHPDVARWWFARCNGEDSGVRSARIRGRVAARGLRASRRALPAEQLLEGARRGTPDAGVAVSTPVCFSVKKIYEVQQ